jgi:hypothetical protein
MPYMTWNNFVTKHGSSGTAFVARWAGVDPGGKLLTNGKIAPKAMALLKEALSKVIMGDWAFHSETIKRASAKTKVSHKMATILVSDPADVAAIKKQFPQHSEPRSPGKIRCTHAVEFMYENKNYGAAIKALGYI